MVGIDTIISRNRVKELVAHSNDEIAIRISDAACTKTSVVIGSITAIDARKEIGKGPAETNAYAYTNSIVGCCGRLGRLRRRFRRRSSLLDGGCRRRFGCSDGFVRRGGGGGFVRRSGSGGVGEGMKRGLAVRRGRGLGGRGRGTGLAALAIGAPSKSGVVIVYGVDAGSQTTMVVGRLTMGEGGGRDGEGKGEEEEDIGVHGFEVRRPSLLFSLFYHC